MKKTRWPVPEDDLVEILNNSLVDTEYLRNSQIAVLGGSGFIGTWIVSFLDFANDALNLNIEVIVPTRDEILAKRKLLISQDSIIKLLNVDYCETSQVNYQDSKFLIIGATPTNKFTGSRDDSRIKLATKNSVGSVIKFAQEVDWTPNVINLSSGAVGHRASGSTSCISTKGLAIDYWGCKSVAKHVSYGCGVLNLCAESSD